MFLKIIILTPLLLLPNLLLANNNIEISKTSPINISSEKIKIIKKENMIKFLNNVFMEQDGLQMYSDKVNLYYNPSDKKIQYIKAKDNVRFISKDLYAKGNKGSYDINHGIITIEGNVFANSKDSTFKGEKFSYNIITQKSNIVGNKDKRVTITINDNTIK